MKHHYLYEANFTILVISGSKTNLLIWKLTHICVCCAPSVHSHASALRCVPLHGGGLAQRCPGKGV